MSSTLWWYLTGQIRRPEKREWAGPGECSQCALGILHPRDECDKHYPPEKGNER